MTEHATYADVLDRARGLVEALSRPPVVGIAGHGGAGKTTLARRLAADLGFGAEQVVRTDRLYAATDTRRAGLFELQDWPVILDLLRRVRADPAPERLRYATRGYDGEEDVVDLPMPTAVAVEGIRVIRPETLPLLDLAVWIDLDPESAGARAKARNGAAGRRPGRARPLGLHVGPGGARVPAAGAPRAPRTPRRGGCRADLV